nr:hypothetical protein [Pandoravirus belohorizontensis]
MDPPTTDSQGHAEGGLAAMAAMAMSEQCMVGLVPLPKKDHAHERRPAVMVSGREKGKKKEKKVQECAKRDIVEAKNTQGHTKRTKKREEKKENCTANDPQWGKGRADL